MSRTHFDLNTHVRQVLTCIFYIFFYMLWGYKKCRRDPYVTTTKFHSFESQGIYVNNMWLMSLSHGLPCPIEGSNAPWTDWPHSTWIWLKYISLFYPFCRRSKPQKYRSLSSVRKWRRSTVAVFRRVREFLPLPSRSPIANMQLQGPL